MGFCGACGKQAEQEDKFCTGCGTTIKESQVTVLENTGQIIKEEYRVSTAPPESDLSRGSHIGDQKKSGEWLEFTTANILKFGGYQTIRQYAVNISDETRDKFYVDVLASDPYVDIFVECKDYEPTKMSEKILFEFVGQLNHYRKLQSKSVVGILVMSARDDSRNKAIREKLSTENAFLWDGSFLEHLQNKMSEVEKKEEFHTYLVNHLNIDENVKTEPHHQAIINRMAFYTVRKHEYIGKKFDVMNIIDDIKKFLTKAKTLEPPYNEFKIVNYEIESVKDESGNLIRYLVHVDFSCPITNNDLEDAKKKMGWMNKLRKKHPLNFLSEKLDEVVRTGILPNIYGIYYDKSGKDNFGKIYFEGARFT